MQQNKRWYSRQDLGHCSHLEEITIRNSHFQDHRFQQRFHCTYQSICTSVHQSVDSSNPGIRLQWHEELQKMSVNHLTFLWNWSQMLKVKTRRHSQDFRINIIPLWIFRESSTCLNSCLAVWSYGENPWTRVRMCRNESFGFVVVFLSWNQFHFLISFPSSITPTPLHPKKLNNSIFSIAEQKHFITTLKVVRSCVNQCMLCTHFSLHTLHSVQNIAW